MIWGVGGILSATAVVLLYGSRPKQTIDVVSTDQFFSEAHRASVLVRFAVPRAQWVSLLLLMVLCFGLTVLAWNQAHREFRNEAIVVDVSASMGAGERLEQAASIVAARWGRGPLFGAATDALFLLHGETADASGPVTVLKQWTPSGVSLPARDLIQRARSVVPSKSLYVISDRSAPAVIPDNVTWHTVGDSNPNIGVVDFVAERTDALGSLRSTAVVHNPGSTDAEVQVTWSFRDTDLKTQRVTVRANQSTPVRADVHLPDSGMLSVSLSEDGWIPDNLASLEIPPAVPVIVSGADVSPFWISAFEAHPNVTWAPAHPNPDVWIAENPDAIIPEAGRYLFVGKATSLLGAARWNPQPQWGWVARQEPLLDYADVRQLNVQGAWELDWPDSKPLVRTQQGSVVSVGRWRSQPTLAWGIELSATDAALRTQFVNWVANVVRWSTPELRQIPDTQTNPLSAVETADIADSRQADPTGLAWSLIWMVGVGALCLVWMMDCVLWRRVWRRAPVRTVVPRVLVLVLLGLLGWAPWGAIWVPPPQPVYLFDHSDSMALMDAVEHPVSVRFPNPELGESGSPLLPALRRGLAQIPAGVRGEFIISSDGRWTDYAWDAATIQEFVAPHSARVLGRTGDASTVHCGLDTPWVRAGEVVQIQLVHAGQPTRATTWTVDGGTVVAEMRGTRQRESGYTEQDFDLSIPLTRTPGPVTIAATVSGQVQCTLGVVVRPSQRIWMVADDPEQLRPLQTVLSGSGFEVHFARPEEMGSVDLADVDVLVLGSAFYEQGNALDQWLPRVRRAVGEGLGLFTVGGRQSYDSGRWGLSALQDVVPLALETEEEALDGQVSFLAILDKSGSMAFDAGDRPRMAWANAATLGAIRQLRDTDRAGVLAVDDALHWIQKMRTVETHSAFSAVKDIRGGKGGILVYSALKEAQKALQVESSPVRHVVLFADAQDAEEKVKGQLFGWGPGPSALDVAKDMAEEGITLSVVAIGDPRDQDVAFLELLASVGKGRFHLTSNAQDLVGLFTQETQRLVTKRALEGNVQVEYAETAPYLEGVDIDDVPPLQRVELVQTRATVQPFWQTKTGEPVLASWRFGLGRVTSFTGSPDSVASWKNWENAPLFWKQSMRWAGQPELELREELSLQRTQAGDVVVTRPMPKTAAVPQYTVSGGAQRWMRPVAAGRWSQRITSPRHGHTEAQKLQVAFGEQPAIERWLPGWYPQEFGIPETLPRPPKGSAQAIGAHVTSLWPIWTGLLWFLIPFSVWAQRVRSL